MKNSTARKLEQVPKGCLVMGVDPHKKRHAAIEIKGLEHQCKTVDVTLTPE